jgi:hypothetical protein
MVEGVWFLITGRNDGIMLTGLNDVVFEKEIFGIFIVGICCFTPTTTKKKEL